MKYLIQKGRFSSDTSFVRLATINTVLFLNVRVYAKTCLFSASTILKLTVGVNQIRFF